MTDTKTEATESRVPHTTPKSDVADTGLSPKALEQVAAIIAAQLAAQQPANQQVASPFGAMHPMMAAFAARAAGIPENLLGGHPMLAMLGVQTPQVDIQALLAEQQRIALNNWRLNAQVASFGPDLDPNLRDALFAHGNGIKTEYKPGSSAKALAAKSFGITAGGALGVASVLALGALGTTVYNGLAGFFGAPAELPAG